MKKNLLTVGLLLVAFSAHAQNNVLTHVDKSGIFYVGKDALVYNGGGLQTKDNGLIENHGSIMIDGTSADGLRTVDVNDKVKPYNKDAVNIINKLNEESAFATWNDPTNTTSAPGYTYGQLKILGIPQENITAMVTQEYRNPAHGDYQQMAIPFFNKQTSTLSAEIGKWFSIVRRSKNEILAYDNSKVVMHTIPDMSIILGQNGTLQPYTYYSLGMQGYNISSSLKKFVGAPVSDITNYIVSLKDAGANVTFGSGGGDKNQYGERYNTYLQDVWERNRGNVWTNTYGKNIYQFGNPYMTNLDLGRIKTLVPNILGLRFEPGGVNYNTSSGGASASVKYVTFKDNIAVGDFKYMMVRPMSTFVIKMNDNSAPVDLNLANLRSFEYTFTNPGGTSASKMTAKSAKTFGTVKQLGIVGLNAQGEEVSRAYYVVAPNTVTGNSAIAETQVSNYGNPLGTFEEDPINGGYDNNVSGNYWLYINEANEVDFLGKNVKLVKYPEGNITQFKFEIVENGIAVVNNAHKLSAGEGFYFKGPDGQVRPILNNAIIAASGGTTQDYDLYYGVPGNDSTLGVDTAKTPSRTFVVYNPSISNYIVRFDPKWKKADIMVYDMSGKLVITSKNVITGSDFVLNLDSSPKGVYLVVVKSEAGEVTQSKIVKQ